jgi:hypothetical protein
MYMAQIYISDKQYSDIIENTDEMPEQYVGKLIRTAIEKKQMKEMK